MKLEKGLFTRAVSVQQARVWNYSALASCAVKSYVAPAIVHQKESEL